MAGNQTNGEKTEQATPKKLRDARKRGEIAKSRDLTGTVGLAVVLVLFWSTAGWGAERLVALTTDALAVPAGEFDVIARLQGRAALDVLVALAALTFVPVAMVGLLVEFLQAGPVFAMEKITPKLSHLDPFAGTKKMFAMDNLVEVLKSIVKTAVIFAIMWLVVAATLERLVWLPDRSVAHAIATTLSLLARLAGWTLAVFALLTLFDVAWQRHSFAKKQRMSIKDIRDEHKSQEGDPMLNGHRRQMHQEFAQEAPNQAAREANVVVVNPTHVAIAIRFDAVHVPVPEVTAKGRDEQAMAIREAANEANVPVLRNEALAWQLLRDVEEGDVVPEGLFDVVAAVILWAEETREAMRTPAERAFDTEPETPPRVPPGEDLTRYPGHRPMREEAAAAGEATQAEDPLPEDEVSAVHDAPDGRRPTEAASEEIDTAVDTRSAGGTPEGAIVVGTPRPPGLDRHS